MEAVSGISPLESRMCSDNAHDETEHFLTKSQDEKIAALQDKFPMHSPTELLRFLRARRWSVERAGEMLESYTQWRQGEGSSVSLARAANAIPANYIRLHGKATDCTPIIFVQGARYDAKVKARQYLLACAHA